MRVRHCVVTALAVFAFLAPLLVLAGQADARFEGIWVGTETFQAQANIRQNGQTISNAVLIAIADPKKEVGVVQGIGVGRYAVSDKFSGGNTLVFTSNGPVRFAKLVMSADGKTFTETGQAMVGQPNMIPAAMCTVSGTFHRQNRK